MCVRAQVQGQAHLIIALCFIELYRYCIFYQLNLCSNPEFSDDGSHFLAIKYIFKHFLCPCHAASGILVPQPGMEISPPAVGSLSLNHWTPREVPAIKYFKIKICIFLDILLLHTIDYNAV